MSPIFDLFNLINVDQISSVGQLATLFAAGIVGALSRELLLKDGCLSLWYVEKKKSGARTMHLGFVSSLLIGGFIGVLVDQSFFTAFTWALCGPYVFESIISHRTGSLDKTLDLIMPEKAKEKQDETSEEVSEK